MSVHPHGAYGAQAHAPFSLCAGAISPYFNYVDVTLQEMAAWYHLKCIFNAQKRAKTWKVDSSDVLQGFALLETDDQATVQAAIDQCTDTHADDGSGCLRRMRVGAAVLPRVFGCGFFRVAVCNRRVRDHASWSPVSLPIH